MGVVSGAAAKSHGKVTGIIPYAIIAAGGEKDKGNGHATASTVSDALDEKRRGEVRFDKSLLPLEPESFFVIYLDRDRELTFDILG